jgi:uncharacterized protein YggE
MRTLTALAALAALAVAAPAANADTTPRTIQVVGDATLSAKNDTAAITITTEVARPTRSGALNAGTAAARRVRVALAKLGVAPADIETTSITVTRVRGRSRGKVITRYRVANEISVTLRDATKTGPAIDAATRAGATDISGPEFSLADPTELYRRALDAAFDDARAKAQRLAAKAGATLGPATTVKEGVDVTPVTGPSGSGSDQAKAPTPVSPGKTEVTGTVTVTFEMH